LLDGLPLALAQAAAYMTETGTTFSTYTRLYKEQWPQLMEPYDGRNMPLRNYINGSIATTWTISYMAIRRESKAAANLLLLWAHLDHKSLWYELLANASKNSNVAAKQIAVWLEGMAQNEVEFIKAIRILRNYSLVEEVENKTGYSTHPVVHQWALYMQDEDHRVALSWLATVLVGFAIPDLCEPNFWETSTRLFAHAERLEIFTMENIMANQQIRCGNDEEEQTLTEAMCYLAKIYSDLWRPVKAEKIYMLVLQIEKKLSRDSGVVALEATNDLGDLYRQQKDFSKAEVLLSSALEGRRRLLGEDHVSTLEVIRTLGILNIEVMRFEIAEDMLLQALKGYKKIFGGDDLESFSTIHNLGVLYHKQKDLKKAEEML
jgi:tetratricopeptide (TPR) repeat protein